MPVFRARSALTVPPGFGGLLRASPCRFVAPCSRPWGSLRFRLIHRFSPARFQDLAALVRGWRRAPATSPGCVRPPPGSPSTALTTCCHAVRPVSGVPAPFCPRCSPVWPVRRPASPSSPMGVRTGFVPVLRLSRSALPFGVFPSTVAVPRHRGRCPLAVRFLPIAVSACCHAVPAIFWRPPTSRP